MSYQSKWFYYLRKKRTQPDRECLESYYGADILSKALVVCQKTNIIRFALFESVNQFLRSIQKTPKSQHCYYEVIFMRKQKPHFDIDIDLSHNHNIDDEEIVKKLIEAIKTVLSGYNIKIDPIRDILIFSSHGETKKSYHVIVDHYYHSDNINAYCFYEKVVDLLPGQYRPFIDHSVYKTVQQFRMLGNSKFGTNRVKKWHQRGEYLPNDLFKASLISYISECQELPSFEDSKQFEEEKDYTSIDLDDSDLVTGAMKLLGNYLGIKTTSSEFPFYYEDTVDNFIILKRLRPTECRVCRRIHENENPFMFISDGVLYLNCRREPDNKSIRIGYLRSAEEIEKQKEAYPEIYNFFEKEKVRNGNLKKGELVNDDLEKEKLVNEDFEKEKLVNEDFGKEELVNEDFEKEKLVNTIPEKEKLVNENFGKEKLVNTIPEKEKPINARRSNVFIPQRPIDNFEEEDILGELTEISKQSLQKIRRRK